MVSVAVGDHAGAQISHMRKIKEGLDVARSNAFMMLCVVKQRADDGMTRRML